MRWKRQLGDQIKQARAVASLTQDQLAALVKVSRQMVSRYEIGEAAPSIEVLARAAQVLHTEFYVEGIRITLERTANRSIPTPVPKQLKLDFDKARRFQDAIVEITARKNRILIRADIPA